MGILKISFLLRSPSVAWDYKSTNQSDLFEDLTKALETVLAPTKPIYDRKGNVQYHCYVATSANAQQQKAVATKLLENLALDENSRKMIIISVVEPQEDELKNVQKKARDSKNTLLEEAIQRHLSSFKKDGSAKSALSFFSEVLEQDSKGDIEEPSVRDGGEEQEEPISLSVRAKKFYDLKQLLLSKVRGQRHAVDTVVEGIFESEMFSSQNENRKGPLATFLFTGPSGVGKTFLASLCGEVLNRKLLIVDMSEYSDNLANMKFNGEHGKPAIITEFARKHPNGIILFDEVEKAHMNTIYMFLQILDGARMMDHKVREEVSFKDNIIIMTTNAGQQLYEDATVFDLSLVPRSVILDGLRKDVNQQTRTPYFPECITTRMANGRVILFNHLEPYSLLQIVQDEIALQVSLFEKTTGIKVHYDPVALSALVLYNGGGVADARTLRGLGRNIVTKELQEVIMQLLALGTEQVDRLQEITLTIDTQTTEEVGELFRNCDRMQIPVLTEVSTEVFDTAIESLLADFDILKDEESFKRRIRGITDYVLLDPLCGNQEKERIPNDVEDLDSVGMRMFDYIREFAPEIPVYILDTTSKIRSFDSLLGRGARGVIRLNTQDNREFTKKLEELSFGALVNNAAFSLGRANKFLEYNSAQYVIDESCVVVSFEKLHLKSALQAGDGSSIARKGENNNLKFQDVIGCKLAKEALADYKEMLEDPRKTILKGKRMPKGVLLYGPPGTGKTMLAKAMANECDATFIPVSAASFFGPLVGETEKNIQDLFKKARKYAPSIIFIDEVDAIGRIRTGSIGSTHSEDALTVFLSEMDGFVMDEKRPVFVLAATNYELEGESGRVLDPAFVRRFDQKIRIPLPDTDDRYALLEKSLERHGIHFGEDHEKLLKNMAKRTGGMNNADLEMINANYVRTLGDGQPNGVAYMDSLDSYRFGEVNKMDPGHIRKTACHEAGHALICRLCGETPSFLTVVSRGSYGGFMESSSEDKVNYTYRELMDRVCRCLAGRAAEIEVYGEEAGNNTGASSDIRQARYFMKTSLNEYAMGEKLYARWTQDEIEEQMQREYQRTRQLIQENRAVLDALTDCLVQHKSMDQTQLEEFFTNMNI